MNTTYFTDLANTLKQREINQVLNYTFKLNNGETVSVAQLIDEANKTRSKRKKND